MRNGSTTLRSTLTAGPLVGLLASLCPAVLAAGGTTHNTASLTAAKLAPEPFASNWEKCHYAIHPDYMRDQPVGHEHMRWSGLLYTWEAVRYLRGGQVNRAMMLASARSHYITDSACISHAEIWRPRKEGDLLRPGRPGSGPWSFMPARYQGYTLPFDERVEGKHYEPLRVGPPPLCGEAWESLTELGLSRSMHAFFDRAHGQAPYPEGFPTEGVPPAENWSCYDREFYARWRAECIALDMLDRESVLRGDDPVEWVSAQRFQRNMDEQMRNMSSAVLAYYRYLDVAARTEVVGDIEELLPGQDRLMLLARRQPRIHLDFDAPWPLKRAAYLLASELVRAEYRARGLQGRQYGEGLRERADALFAEVPTPAGEAERRVIVSWSEEPGAVQRLAGRELSGNTLVCERGATREGYVILRGDDLQSAVHLVDYFLDLTNAPLNGKTPVDVMMTIFQREWAGLPFMEALRQTPDEDIYQPRFERPPNVHEDDAAEWTDRVHWMVWPNTEGDGNLSGPLPVLWNLMLLDLPLPDGSSLDLSAM